MQRAADAAELKNDKESDEFGHCRRPRPVRRGKLMRSMFVTIVAMALVPACSASAQEAAAPPKISDIMAHQQQRHIKPAKAAIGRSPIMKSTR